MTHKVIFLNGPPGCGKDTIASFLYKAGVSRHLKFATPIKEAAQALFNISDLKYRVLEKAGAQEEKSLPLRETGGRSWRSILIWLAETTKKEFGSDIFGYLAADKMIHEVTGAKSTVFSDTGFPDELIHLVKVYKPENCELWRIHREGCTFQNDSRQYIHDIPIGVNVVDINNQYDMELFERQIMRHAGRFLGMSL